MKKLPLFALTAALLCMSPAHSRSNDGGQLPGMVASSPNYFTSPGVRAGKMIMDIYPIAPHAQPKMKHTPPAAKQQEDLLSGSVRPPELITPKKYKPFPIDRRMTF